MLYFPGDLIEYIFGFLNQYELFEMRPVCKEFKKHVALRVLYDLKITQENIHLLDLNTNIFKNLKVLDCCASQLTKVPHIEGLKTLNCSWNQLTQIPHIEGLKVLYCSNNQLTEIPQIEGCHITN